MSELAVDATGSIAGKDASPWQHCHGEGQRALYPRLRNVLFPSAADAVGFVQKVLPVAQGRFRILVYRHDDCLDVVEAIALKARSAPDFGERPLAARISRLCCAFG
jgi:hypothetical protein